MSAPPPVQNPRLDRAAVAGFMLLGALVMVNASSVVDTARDIYWAWQIASGSEFKLEGPDFGRALHGGPVWFYVLAVPLWITPNWVVLNLWVGLLTALKYPLAYACGNRLGGPSLGLLWAAFMALPDWTAINYLIFSHTNLVQAAVLLAFYGLLIWRQGAMGGFYLLCFAVGLGIHAHPTAYAAGVFALPFIARATWRRELDWWQLLAGVALSLVLFVPAWISQALQGWTDLESSRTFIENQPVWQNLAGSLDVLSGTVVDGPLVALRRIVGLEGAWVWVAYAVYAAIVAGGLVLCVLAAFRRDVKALALLAAIFVFVACVSVIRQVTPFYMALAIYPPLYGAAAYGWSCRESAKPLASLAALAALAILCVFVASTARIGWLGYLQVPHAALNDIRSHDLATADEGVYYPAWGRKALGRFICAQEVPVYFHAYAAMVLEQSYALEARMRCDRPRVFIGGPGEGIHYAGVSRHDAGQMGIQGIVSFGSMELFEIEQVHRPLEAQIVPEGNVYPPRPSHRSAAASDTLTIPAESSAWLAVTNLWFFWMPFDSVVRLNGEVAEPLVRGSVTSYYACARCSGEGGDRWSVTIDAPRTDLVEVVTFRPKPGEQAAAP